MATVYSLVCWGGKDGKTVTMTIASPCVVTITNHGLRDGTGVVFSTTGVLPTGITAGTTYYAKSTASGTFNIYDTAAHAIAGGSTGIVNTSGSQSGTHNAKGAYYLGLTAKQKARYGSPGSENIYESMSTWNTNMAARSGDSDVEYCEIGEAFTDIYGSGIQISRLLARCFIHTKINGERTNAFHGGVSGKGYVLQASANAIPVLNIQIPYITVDGFEAVNTHSNGHGIVLAAPSSNASAMIFTCPGASSTNVGVYITSATASITNSVITNFDIGLKLSGYTSYALIANNLICKNLRGVSNSQTTNIYGVFINNVVVDNSTYNWQRQSSVNKASCNVGELADKLAVSVDYTTDIFTLSAHAITSGAKLVFTTSGTLPAPLEVGTIYYARDITTDTFKVAATSGGAAVNITDNGSSTHYLSYVWDTKSDALHIDMSDKANIWVDYDNGDYRPASASSVLVNAGADYYDADEIDIADNVRPNYESATYPDNTWDIGPFEFDHGEGLAPSSVPISITGMASGSEFAVYKASDMSQIVAPASTTGSYSGTYAYTGDVNIIVRVRKGSAATKYLPYEYTGTITSTGFALVVSQIPDAIA